MSYHGFRTKTFTCCGKTARRLTSSHALGPRERAPVCPRCRAPMKRDRLHECLACRRYFIRAVVKGKRAPFCAECVNDSMRFVALVALTLGVAFSALALAARVLG